MTTTIAPTIQAEGGLADDVLQAARKVVEQYSSKFPVYGYSDPWQGCGAKNQPLLTLLDQLICAIEPVAAAVADNAWDDGCPLSATAAKGLIEALHRVTNTIASARVANCPSELPSFSEAASLELV